MVAIILDTESTGLNSPALIEAAWLLVPDPNRLTPVAKFHQRFEPGKPIELGALATHHIMDEDLVDCPPCAEFKIPEGIEYLIGHNVDYDWAVIGKPEVKRIDVLALCRSNFPHLDSHKQSAMLYYFARAQARDLLKNAHSAGADVYNCRIILDHLLTMMFQPGEHRTWEKVWQQSERARVPKVMPFGKHKGTSIAQIPADYKRWLLGQPDVDPYLVKALRGEAA